jgi:hypothetical protein
MFIPSSQILVTLMKEALSACETPALTKATRRNIPEDSILISHRREIIKSYIIFLLEKDNGFLILNLDPHN